MRPSASEANRVESGYLSLLGGFAAGLLLLLAVAYGVLTWRDVRDDQINQLDTALVLSQKALDRFFVESQAQLRELSMVLKEDHGLDDLAVARRLLRRYAELHADAVAVTLMRPDGRVLATSGEDAAPPESLPSMATFPSLRTQTTVVAWISGSDMATSPATNLSLF